MKSIAEDLNVSEEKATEIYNAVLRNIPSRNGKTIRICRR